MIKCQQAMNVPTGSIALSQVRNPPQSRKAARSRGDTPKASLRLVAAASNGMPAMHLARATIFNFVRCR